MNVDLLSRLLSSHGVSGDESDIGQIYSNYLNPYCEIRHDAINNYYAILNSHNDKRVMIDAHIDEIGFQVSYVDDYGFVYLRKTGGIDASCLAGSQVAVKSRSGEMIPGVIGKRPIHIQKPEEMTKVIDMDEIWVDTGLESQNVMQKIMVGDYVSFQPNMMRLSEDRIVSKSIDNRVGVFVMCETMKSLAEKGVDLGIYGVATTQEEIGCKGAKVSCTHVKPTMAFCIDTGFATDVPNIPKKKYGDVVLGGGVTINYHADCNKELTILTEQVAQQNNIPFQRTANRVSSGGTNTAMIQTSEKGVKTLLLSIPCRYMHTQVEMCDLRDIESTIKLLVETIIYIDKNRLI